MNIVTVADIKRSGFAALDAALERGPVHLMKRNKPSAVLLRPEDYERLVQLAYHNAALSGRAGLDMLLLPEPEQAGGLGAEAMQQRLAQMHAGWPER
ncbi:MAG: type II toxin-antitoxin system Phd/YefM family antitoxin [Hydrogenophaga sp.]|jgi:PHD/YefM family antitoxin component YafN of YafNO toxin-antitoxin module|nr:type II toxin-antitoxin system Phd/YefM family antitoxin [Hydrogenophaga sp.]